MCRHAKNRPQARCKEEGCSGSQICKDHGIQKRYCKDEACGGGSAYCKAHEKLKEYCKDEACNGGSAYCGHGKRRTRCKDEACNGGSAFCKAHGIQKQYCKDEACGGGWAFCVCGKLKELCHKCDQPIHPQNWCQSCKYVKIRKSRYKPYCFGCFCYLNPDAEIPRQRKFKEHHMRDAIIEKFPEFNLVWDKTVDEGCSLKRPDGRLECFTHTIVIECDENQHKGYSCENKRIMQLFQDLGHRPLVVIRFNPDSYQENGQTVAGCFTKLKTVDNSINKPEWNRRIPVLLDTIAYHQKTIPTKELTVVELFYSKAPE